jgi:hypothetical protein
VVEEREAPSGEGIVENLVLIGMSVVFFRILFET